MNIFSVQSCKTQLHVFLDCCIRPISQAIIDLYNVNSFAKNHAKTLYVSVGQRFGSLFK